MYDSILQVTVKEPGLTAYLYLSLGFLIIGLGIVLFIFLLISRRNQNELYLKQEQMKLAFEQEILQSKIEVQEMTFQHIGQELHDNIGQLLSSAKMLIGVSQIQLSDPPDSLVTANETIGKAIEEMRGLSRSLDHHWLSQFDLKYNLQSELERIEKSGHIQTQMSLPEPFDIPNDQQIILFRMIQEACQNAIKHANPGFISILGKSLPQHWSFQIINDGKPLPAEFQGMGTRNMQSRAAILNGTVDWSHQNHQTTVSIEIPKT